MQSPSVTHHVNGDVSRTNGRSLPTSKPLSPLLNNVKPTGGQKSATIDNASLEELDRIMDTLSTLSRSTSLGRTRRPSNLAESISPQSSDTSNGILSMSPVSPLSATSPTSSTNSPYLPPRMTSPPVTPMVQSPTRYVPNHDRKSFKGNSKVLNNEATSSKPYFGGNNQGVRSRFPSEYENSGSQQEPSNYTELNTGNYSGNQYEQLTPDVVKNKSVKDHPGGNNSDRYFYGPLPMSPRTEKRENIQTNPNYFMQPLNQQRQTFKQPQPAQRGKINQGLGRLDNMDPYGTAKAGYGNTPAFPRGSVDAGQGQPDNEGYKKYHTVGRDSNDQIPLYNDKKSYLSNLENGTLPRSKLDIQRQHEGEVKLRNKQIGDAGSDMYNVNGSRKSRIKNRIRSTTKPPSQQSRSSYTSYSEGGRGYASVSTARASNSLIHSDIFRTNLPTNLDNGNKSEPSNTTQHTRCGPGNCCIRCGRYLHAHLLEMFILAAFCSAIPLGIILQATGIYKSHSFQKYFIVLGTELTINLLATLTPITVFISVLYATATFPWKTFKRVSLYSIIFYTVSLLVAACLSSGIVLSIKPGVTTNGSVSLTNSTKNLPKNDVMLKYYFDATLYRDYSQSSASDEVLLLLKLFMPGCLGSNAESFMNIPRCNLFILFLFGIVLGCAIASSGPDAKPLRRVISELAFAVTRMNGILFWYLPLGVLLAASEFVATKIEWGNIGHDRQTSSVDSFVQNLTSKNIYPYTTVPEFQSHLKWYLTCVLATLFIYGFCLLPFLVAIATRSNPFSLLGCRSLAPILLASTIGFSDITIPLTARCLYKQRRRSSLDSVCCFPAKYGVDERLGQYSATTCGIFHRCGSLILLVCSSIFVAQIHGENLSPMAVIFICTSSIIVSIITVSGRWYEQRNAYFYGMMIILNSAGFQNPTYFPRLLFCFWIVCRCAAVVDTLSGLLIAYLINHVCRKELDKVIETEDRRCSVAVSNAETKVTAIATPLCDKKIKSKGSDYEESPLLFNSYFDPHGSGESVVSDARDQVNDNVFYPNGAATDEHNQKLLVKLTNKGVEGQNYNANNNTQLQSTNRTNHVTQKPIVLTNYKDNRGIVHDESRQNTNDRIPITDNREETSFVTF